MGLRKKEDGVGGRGRWRGQKQICFALGAANTQKHTATEALKLRTTTFGLQCNLLQPWGKEKLSLSLFLFFLCLCLSISLLSPVLVSLSLFLSFSLSLFLWSLSPSLSYIFVGLSFTQLDKTMLSGSVVSDLLLRVILIVS